MHLVIHLQVLVTLLQIHLLEVDLLIFPSVHQMEVFTQPKYTTEP